MDYDDGAHSTKEPALSVSVFRLPPKIASIFPAIGHPRSGATSEEHVLQEGCLSATNLGLESFPASRLLSPPRPNHLVGSLSLPPRLNRQSSSQQGRIKLSPLLRRHGTKRMETTKGNPYTDNVESNGEPTSGFVKKQSFGSKVKRHCARFWWLWLLVIVAIVLVVVLPM